MAGKHHFSPANSRTRSPALLCGVSLLALSLFFYVIYVFSSFSTSIPTHPSQNPNDLFPSPKADYSFVASLEKLLTASKFQRSRALPDDTVRSVSEEDVNKLDDRIWKKEVDRLIEDSSYPVISSSPLQVYVYEMPSKFTYDLLWLFHNTYKKTSNLTSNGSPVHRLIEQHSIDYWLWADLIAPEPERLLKNVVRVQRQDEADLFYIPFFTTISFFLLEKQQCKALYRVKL